MLAGAMRLYNKTARYPHAHAMCYVLRVNKIYDIRVHVTRKYKMQYAICGYVILQYTYIICNEAIIYEM